MALEIGITIKCVEIDAFYLPALTKKARIDNAAERDKRTVVFIFSLFSLFLFVRKKLRCVC